MYVTDICATSAILVLLQTVRINTGNNRIHRRTHLSDKTLGFKSIRIQSIQFGFRIQNLRTRDENGTFLFRIRPPVYERQTDGFLPGLIVRYFLK